MGRWSKGFVLKASKVGMDEIGVMVSGSGALYVERYSSGTGVQ